ncbi:MAG TPA: protein adenylyltransferase SelO family protein, partial [Polyangiales bacterium]|nr:protein adenylyltransferase SelO family protein [Polyangiales bacterium]
SERGDRDALLAGLFPALSAIETDMTLFFRALPELPDDSRDAMLHALRDAFYDLDGADRTQLDVLTTWLEQYRECVRAEGASRDERRARMHAVNPLYLPRNYLLQQVIDATQAGDRAALADFMQVLAHPYDRQPGREAFAAKRPDWARHKPGCSMLSCSS